MKKIYFFVLVVALFSGNYGVAQSVNSYNLGDNSTFTNTGTQWDPVTSTTSPDGKLRTQAATSLWHSAGYGVAFQNGNSLEVDVEGIATIRFYGSVYSSGTMDAGTTIGGNDLGTMDVDMDAYPDMSDQTGYYEFSYTGGSATLYFTFTGSNAYTPSIEVISPTTSYNLGDGSTFTNTGIQWDPVTSTTSPDGKLRTQAATSLWHSTGYGVAFQNGNSLEVDVAEGSSTVRFYGSVYSSGTMDGGTTIGGNDLGTIDSDIDAHPGMADQTGYYEFTYTGGATTLYFTFSGPNAYTPAIDVTTLESTIIKTDVWDFAAEQLDEVLYNNMLTESTINSWYDGSIAVGSSGNVFPSAFSAGALSWVGGTNDRLRTVNTNLTRYDENISSVSGYSGRVYVNAGGATGRYMSLMLDEDDEVTVMMLTQSGTGSVHFEYATDPAIQDDVVAVGGDLQEVNFVAKEAGEYHIYDAVDKPSYYRIMRKDAEYVTLTGNVDETFAAGIPDGYSIIFTNEAGKEYAAVVSSGTYTIDLPIEYTYNLSLGGANGYIITNGLTFNATEETTIYDIVVAQVDIYNVSGNITGLTDLTGVTLAYTPDSGASTVYTPIVTIDEVAFTYSVDLEAGIEYTISAEGVNDYEILTNTITIGSADETADVDFTPKPLYNVAINAIGLDATQESELSLTFTNLNEEGYSYDFTDINAVSLRDGVYTVSYNGIDAYPLRLALTSNLTVAGSDTSKDLTFNPISLWTFNDRVINAATAYEGLMFTGSVNVRGNNGDLNAGSGSTIAIPVQVGDKVIITDYYSSNYSVEGEPAVTNTSNSTSTNVVSEYVYPGATDGTVTITVNATSYFVSFEVVAIEPYSPIITVGVDKDFQTINEALDAISRMDRPNDEPVTVMIDPGNYEEMIVISINNVTLKNASSNPSIALLNSGVDIDANAVRITSYYGQKYNFFSQGTDNKWSAEALAVNTENGYTEYINQEGTGGGSSYWNATVVITAQDVTIEDIILENSFNQYISLKESQDVVQAKAPSEPTRPTDYGNTSVQDRSAGYVTQAAAIGIAASADRVVLDECRVIGRQDSFYGAQGARVAIYKGAMMGAVDYLFGGMTAVFYQTDLVLNTSDYSSDAAYITAAQQTSGRGYLMYECHVKSTIPGVETASTYGSKPGYYGRPWAPNTSEVVFYNTTIDESTYPGSEGLSLISPEGWTSSLGGVSSMMYEYGTIENASGVDNSGTRAPWSTVLSSPTLTDGTAITTFNFTKGTDDWDPFPELLSVGDFKNAQSSAFVKTYNQKLHISNVTSENRVLVYAITGALVKDFETSVETSVDIEDGIWIVKLIDGNGSKVFKLISH
ncbi:pectinesterase family protein [Winogradskyella sp. MH6]|uniref:pectinesterase family protein n=1 Tax=Winogradskyella sp. MH6 TaxID=2929510 RepID=UPI001FB41B08|nr:pectinesterase family protein [Winogradskyella sp. MH6]